MADVWYSMILWRAPGKHPECAQKWESVRAKGVCTLFNNADSDRHALGHASAVAHWDICINHLILEHLLRYV